ncbi:MAG: porin, partial [Pseudomonadota bacterium]|nr:porin [Pseudomonadota bacterium]
RLGEKWGVFARQSNWSQSEDDSAAQTDFGVNYYPHPDVVFKADVQMQNDDAESRGDINSGSGFNLGMGYQF